MNRRFRACDVTRLHFLANKTQNFDTAGIVAAMPLDIDIASLVGTLAEGGGELGTRIRRDRSHRPQLRRGSGIVQEHRPSTGGHDDGLIDQANIA